MKLLVLSLLASVLSFGQSVSDPKPAVPLAVQHKATHHIVMENVLEGGSCSATAIAPHALLTAGHCIVATNTITVDGEDYKIVRMLFDDEDHAIIVTSATFDTYLVVDVQFDPTVDHAAVHIWGNPGKSTDVYRQGHYLKDSGELRIYQLPVYPGDSGAGVLNDNGQIIDVVSLGDYNATAACLPFAFTKEQITDASK